MFSGVYIDYGCCKSSCWVSAVLIVCLFTVLPCHTFYEQIKWTWTQCWNWPKRTGSYVEMFDILLRDWNL